MTEATQFDGPRLRDRGRKPAGRESGRVSKRIVSRAIIVDPPLEGP